MQTVASSQDAGHSGSVTVDASLPGSVHELPGEEQIVQRTLQFLSKPLADIGGTVTPPLHDPVQATAHASPGVIPGSAAVFVPSELNSLAAHREDVEVQAGAGQESGQESTDPTAVQADAPGVQEQHVQEASPADWTYIDLMAGAAGIAFQMSLMGLRSIAVDYVRNKSVPLIPITVIDLTSLTGQETVLLMLRGGKVAGVGMGPPCGTASRARERPLAKHLLARGMRAPQPLRSEEFPYGIPGLVGSDRERVIAANVLYAFTARVARLCTSLSIPWFIENPHRSHLWGLPEFVRLASSSKQILYDACCHGGNRKKRQQFMFFGLDMEPLAVDCQNNHTHLPYSVDEKGWDTAKEAEYPTLFCERVAKQFFLALQFRVQTQGLRAPVARALAKAVTGQQTNRHKVPNVVSEYKTTVAIKLPEAPKVSDKKHTLTEQSVGGVCVPAGSKLLEARGGDDGELSYVFGIYRTPVEWHAAAAKVQHPSESLHFMKSWQSVALVNVLTHSREQISKHRIQVIKRLVARKEELRLQEEELHSSMTKHMQTVMKGKQVLLFLELAAEAGIVDPNNELKDALVQGFKLSGTAHSSKLFDQLFRPATVDKAKLLSEHSWRYGLAWAGCKPSGDDEVDEALYAGTLEEEKKGWSEGPYSKEELSAMFPGGCIPGRRFAIRQGSKIRLIDDLSVSGANRTVEATERLDLGGIDESVGLAKTLVKLSSTGLHRLPIFGYEDAVFVTNKDWIDRPPKVLGRTLDLKSAYKQLGVNQEDACLSQTTVWNPRKKQQEAWLLRALPFGSSASVYAFNSCARILERILSHLLWLLVSGYFDDFAQLEDVLLKQSAENSSECILTILGWEFAKSGGKYFKFEEVFNLLGAKIDLTHCTVRGSIRVENTQARREAITEEVLAIIKAGCWSAPQAAQLAGRMTFAKTFSSGRALLHSVRQVYKRSSGSKATLALTADEGEALRAIVQGLEVMKPRNIPILYEADTVVIYTDGAVEGDKHSCGGMCFQAGRPPQFFSFEVPEPWKAIWRKRGIRHAVAQTEALPVLVARLVWGDLLMGARSLTFTDNETIRSALITGASENFSTQDILSAISLQDARAGGSDWVARVPSPSNPADAPSRFDVESCVALFGAVQVQPILPSLDSEGRVVVVPLEAVRVGNEFIGATASNVGMHEQHQHKTVWQ